MTGAWQLRTAQLGKLWLRWKAQQLERAVLRLNAPRLRAAYAEHPPVQLEDLAVDAYVDLTEQGYRLLLDRLAFDLKASAGATRGCCCRRSGRAALAAAGRSAERRADRQPCACAAPLPETAVETLGALQPSGTLRNLRADFYPSWIRRSDCAAANPERISFSAQNWIPAVGNGSGGIQGDGQR